MKKSTKKRHKQSITLREVYQRKARENCFKMKIIVLMIITNTSSVTTDQSKLVVLVSLFGGSSVSTFFGSSFFSSISSFGRHTLSAAFGTQRPESTQRFMPITKFLNLLTSGNSSNTSTGSRPPGPKQTNQKRNPKDGVTKQN
uniref:Transmembrane protein n=1 Tax=Glossina brevipalpis TaxID=37001 RepID=A0A1A9WCW7_9MUSC